MPLNTFANRTSSLPLSELDANFTFVSDSTNLSFLQSGTGAVSRTVQAKERDIVSVFDFMTTAQIANAQAGTPTDYTTAVQAAVDALPAGGGMLYFPPGYYLVSSIDLDKQILVQGAGMFSGGTYIIASTATGKVFNITSSSVTIRDLCMNKNVTQSGGAYIYCDTTSSIVNLENLYLLNWYRGIHLLGAGNYAMTHLRLTSGVPTTGQGIRVDDGTAINMYDVLIQSAAASEPSAGIAVTNCGDISMTNVISIGNVNGMTLAPGASQTVVSIKATACGFDNNSSYGMLVQPTSVTGTVQRCLFQGCDFTSSGSSGVLLDTTTVAGAIDGMVFEGCAVHLNGSHGFQAQGTNSECIKFNGGWSAQNTGSGFLFGANVSNWQVTNATIGAIAGLTGNTTRGITSSAGTSDDVLIANNQMTGNTVSALNIASTGSRRTIINNNGYNPVGVSTITVGASPYTYTSGDTPETVYIRAGTVSDVSVGGTALFAATGCTVQLPSNTAVVVTYSSAPTMIKYVS